VKQIAQRIGKVIGIRPDCISAYEAVDAASNPGVRNLLTKYNMHNFSIFMDKLEGDRYYLFGYYEYTGAHTGCMTTRFGRRRHHAA
jgi:L-rhamnose mutarotase